MATSAVHEFDGALILRGDAAYEAVRSAEAWNRRIPDRFPAAILQVASERDVIAGVRLAKSNGWRISVRSGGHSWAHWSLRDDCLLLDMGSWREISSVSESLVVSVTPGVRGGSELAPYLSERGVFFSVGHCPGVGLGGYLLQGGMGWNTRGVGWAAQSILAMDIVTADGELVHADQDTHSDLFWAARGAGPGFFGVVTRFYLQAAPLPTVTGSTLIFPVAETEELLRWAHSVHAAMATTIELVVTAVTMPLPPHLNHHGPVIIANAIAFDDDVERAVADLSVMRSCPLIPRALIVNFDRPTSWLEELETVGGQYPEHHRYAVDSVWTDDDGSAVAPIAARAATTLPSAGSTFLWTSNAPQPVLPDMAFSAQGDVYIALYAAWTDANQDDACRAWLEDAMHRLEPVTTSQYVGDSDFSRRHVRFMSEENFERLEAIQAARDPDGTFVGYLATPGLPLNRNDWMRLGVQK